MAEKQKRSESKKTKGKLGSDPEAIKEFGGKGDFGVPAIPGKDRDYASQNTKASDRGAAQPDSSEFQGLRTHGAGGKASGAGSSSGGDLDPDIIGVGTGGSGVAANPTREHRPGPDDATGTSADFASGKPAEGKNQPDVGKTGGPRPVHRTIARATRDVAEKAGGGADAAEDLQAREDDAFTGEISSGDARGEDDNPDQSSDGDALR